MKTTKPKQHMIAAFVGTVGEFRQYLQAMKKSPEYQKEAIKHAKRVG